jgi:hypothetical protein
MRTVFVSAVIAELWPERVEARRAVADCEIETIPDLLPLLGMSRLRTMTSSAV